MRALIVVDMQYDFIYGSLAVPGAREIIEPIQTKMEEYLESEQVVVLSKCWHPKDHCSFLGFGGKWPAHCVQFTRGARLQIGVSCIVSRYPNARVISKGLDKKTEQYSVFDNPETRAFLSAIQIHEIEVCGLARNYCVAATAEAARNLGYKTTILEDLCRSV